MKVAVTVISGVCMGLLMAFNGLNPLLQAKAIYENRKRVIFSATLMAAAFMLFMAAFILASIDLALQWEVQGFIIWEAILTVAAGFAVLAVISFVTAKLIFPKPKDDMFSMLGQHAGFGDVNVAQVIEAWLGSLQKPEAQRPIETEKAVREEIKDRPRGDMGIDSRVGLAN